MKKLSNEFEFDQEIDELYNLVDGQGRGSIDMSKVNVKVKLLTLKLNKERTKIQLHALSGAKPNSWFFDAVGAIGDANEIKKIGDGKKDIK